MLNLILRILIHILQEGKNKQKIPILFMEIYLAIQKKAQRSQKMNINLMSQKLLLCVIVNIEYWVRCRSKHKLSDVKH